MDHVNFQRIGSISIMILRWGVEMELNKMVLPVLQGPRGDVIARRPIHLYSVSVVYPDTTASRACALPHIPPENVGSPRLVLIRGKVVERNRAEGRIYSRLLGIDVDRGLFGSA